MVGIRQATPGQKAMATALAYPEPTNKGGRGKKNETTVLNTDVSSAYLKHARFVLRNCRDKALEVLRNSKYPLTVAYEEAQAIVEKQRLDEEVRQAHLAGLKRLAERLASNYNRERNLLEAPSIHATVRNFSLS